MKRLLELRERLAAEKIPVQLYTGTEIACSERTLDVIIEQLEWNIPLQINAYSLVEEKNDATRKLARMLLKNKLVTFVGSDAHRTTHRPPNVRSGIDYIYENCDKDYADAICFRNAEHFLFGNGR